MIRIARTVITFIYLGATLGWGQSILSSNYPFGLPLRSISSTALSMGGVSVGVPNDHNVMLTNPGNLGTINITAFSSLWLVDYLRINDKGLYTDHLQASPRQLSFALPLGKVGTIAFELNKTTDATFKFSDEKEEVTNINTSLPVYKKTSTDREGGITSWQAGWGRSIGKYINVGFAYQRAYFTAFNTTINDVIYMNTSYDPAKQELDTTYTTESVRDSTHMTHGGNGIRFGILSTIKKLSIGIASNFFFAGDLSFFNAEYNGSSKTPVDPTVQPKKFTLRMPHSLAAGISYAFSPKWLVGADVGVDLWKYYSLKGYKIVKQFDSENTVSFSTGFRFIPAPNQLIPKYWETIHYRAGMRYSQLPGGVSSEISGSLGFGFPLKGNGLLDIGFELGKRTHDNYPDYNETFLQISLGLNGGRKWNKTPTTTY